MFEKLRMFYVQNDIVINSLAMLVLPVAIILYIIFCVK